MKMDKQHEIVEGFNAGYLVEKYRPELAKQLVKNLEGVDEPFSEGFVAGSKEYSRERSRGKLLTKLRKDFGGKKDSPAKDKGKDMDR